MRAVGHPACTVHLDMGSMRRKVEVGALVLLAVGLPLAACSASDLPSAEPSPPQRPPAAIPVPVVTVPRTHWKLIAVDSAVPESDGGTADED
jgi:hypothetical protein